MDVSATYLVFVLTFGDVLAADLDPRRQETLEKIGAVDTEQVRDALRLCTQTRPTLCLVYFAQNAASQA